MVRLLRPVIVVAAVFAFSGCDKAKEETPAAAKKSPVRQIDPASLPALGEYSPPLDSGRIEIACPEGWELAPRLKNYVALFRGGSGDQYPMILVKATDSTTGPLTADAAVAFASSLADDGSAQAAAIGDRAGALQRKRSKDPGSVDQIIERLLFTTVIGQRTYTVELRTRHGRLENLQDTLFAVVGGMREIGAAAAEAPEAAAPEGTEEEKAEKTEKDSAKKELDEMFE